MIERDAPVAAGQPTGPTSGPEPSPDGVLPVESRRLPTESDLARQDADTAELRRAVEELRQILDVGPAASPLPGRPASRRSLLRPLIALLVVALLVGAGALVHFLGGSNGADAAPGTAQRPGVTGDPAATSGAAPSSPPAGSLPLHGPGEDAPGTVVVAEPAGTGFLMVEQAVLPAATGAQLVLAIPDVRRLGGEIGSLRLTVDDLRVALDGRPVAVRPDGVGRWLLPVTAGRHRIVASYRLEGSVLVSTPSSPGRALGLVAPILGSGLRAGGLPLVVRPVGTQVRSVTCPDAPAALLLCGTRAASSWTADVPASASPVVVVLLDLTPAR
jgi:hypothetical protein